MTHKTYAARRTRTPRVEILEDRRLFSLVVDLRVTGVTGSGITVNDAHNVTLGATASGTITMDIRAIAKGSNASSADDGLMFLDGRFLSTNSTSKFVAKGNLAATLKAPFNDAVAQT